MDQVTFAGRFFLRLLLLVLVENGDIWAFTCNFKVGMMFFLHRQKNSLPLVQNT